MGMGNASRRRGADTSYQRDDDVARPSTEQSTRRGMVGWYSVVSVANPFGVGGSGGGVLAPWWPFHTLGKTAGAAPRPRGGSDNVVKQDEFNTTMSIYTTDARSARRPTESGVVVVAYSVLGTLA